VVLIRFKRRECIVMPEFSVMSRGKLHRGRSGQETLNDAAVLVEQMAAAVRAGLEGPRVWDLLAVLHSDRDMLCRSVSEQIRNGGRAGEGLRLVAPEGTPLHWLALVCDVLDETGAPAGDVLDLLARGIRAEIRAEEEIEAAMAGPRVSATLLSLMPLGGLFGAFALGIDPLVTLVGTPWGRLCVVTGMALWGIGRYWARRIVDRA
jgi:tight adherence protein B